MAKIIFHYSVLILTGNLFVLTTCLDIHYPEYGRTASSYGYLQNVQPVEQQIHYGHPQPSGAYYQRQALDESFRQADYHRPMVQPNYGNMVRRSPPQATFRQSPCSLEQQRQNSYRCYRSIPAPANYPLYPFCNDHNYPTADDNQGAESIPIRGRDSRSAMEPSETQSSDDVAASPPMMIPRYLSIDFNDTKNKRAAQKPPITFYDRPDKRKNSTEIKPKMMTEIDDTFAVEQPASTTLETTIVIPSRMHVNPNIKPESDASLEDYSNCAGGAFGKFNNTKMMESGRSSEPNVGRTYTSGYPEYPKFTRAQRPSESLSAISAVPSVFTGQPSATNVQQQISSYKAKINDNSYNPYEYFKSRSGDSLPLASSPTSTNNSKPYPIYTPNMGRNDSMKYPQVRTSH